MKNFLVNLKRLIPGWTTTLDVVIVIASIVAMIVGLLTEYYIVAIVGMVGALAFVVKEVVNDR